jgi:hypothetical protein
MSSSLRPTSAALCSAPDQPIDQHAIEASHQRIGNERRKARVTAGYGRVDLWEKKEPSAGAAQARRQQARSEPAEEGGDHDRRENRDEGHACQRFAEQ